MIKTALVAGLFTMMVGSLGFAGIASAQYLGNVGDDGQTGQNTIEETLKLAKARITAATDYPSAGSGTPIIDPEGVVGASVIAGAVFGGIAGALFLRGRSGKYAAQGRG